MPKDLKIGMLLGLVLVAAVMLWLFIGPGLSIRITRQGSHGTEAPWGSSAMPNNLSANNSAAIQPDLTIYEQADKIKTQRFHIVRDGETLSEISRKYYDSANKWQKILDANRDAIEDVSKLKPGTKLIIPE